MYPFISLLPTYEIWPHLEMFLSGKMLVRFYYQDSTYKVRIIAMDDNGLRDFLQTTHLKITKRIQVQEFTIFGYISMQIEKEKKEYKFF